MTEEFSDMRKRLIDSANQAGLKSFRLAGAVQSIMDEEALLINDGGIEQQIEFLMEETGPEETETLIQNLISNKKDGSPLSKKFFDLVQDTPLEEIASALDEMVNDIMDQRATDINNGGVEEQAEFIYNEYGASEAESILTKLIESIRNGGEQ